MSLDIANEGQQLLRRHFAFVDPIRDPDATRSIGVFAKRKSGRTMHMRRRTHIFQRFCEVFAGLCCVFHDRMVLYPKRLKEEPSTAGLG